MRKLFGLLASLTAIMFAALVLTGCPTAVTTGTLKVQNQFSVTLTDVKWGNTVVSASLAPLESTTLNVSEGAFYLYFTTGSANGFKCRTKETIAVAKDKTITQTITNNTVVVDLNDASNVGPLGTIVPRETRLTIQNQSSVTLTDVKWGNTVVSASLAPSESTTMNVSAGSSYLYFTKGSADGFKCRTKETIVAKDKTITQTITNNTVVVDQNDATNVAPLGIIGPRETRLTIQNQSSVTLADVTWNNTVISASLAPGGSTTMNVSAGSSYLYFTTGSANGFKCRTKETIAVAKDKTITQTITNNTVVVDLNDAANVRPLGTIVPLVQYTDVTLDSAAMREQFNGDWVGEDIRIQINGDRIVQYFIDKDGEWYAISPEKEYFLYDRNNLVYVWLNKGGVWSETQVFSLSVINADALSLVWRRHVNNIVDNQRNEAWNAKDRQTLFRWKNSGALAAKQVSSSHNTQTIDAQFQGTWIGEITVKDEDGNERGKIPLRVTISSNGVTQYFQDNNGNWYAVSADKDTYAYDRNNIVYSWVDKGGVWSETQVFSLSLLSNRTMSIVWLRHVNNYYETLLSNDVWNLTGEGELTKQ